MKDLSMEQIRMLVNTAIQARENAYAPYSHFKVGAAVLGTDGKVYTGCNIENASYGAALCAERVAIAGCISDKKRHICRIAICSTSGNETFPCGICRQVMSEFMDEDSQIILETKDGGFHVYTLAELLPYSFNSDSMNSGK